MRKLLLLVSAALLLTAQAPVFQGSVALVRVDIQAFTNGRAIPDLTAGDFRVYDNDQLQPIEHFGREAEPLSLLLLVDVSGSMARYIDQMTRSAAAALKFLQPGDQVAVMFFGRRAEMIQDFTADRRYVARALEVAARDPELGSGTVINPSLRAAVDRVREQVTGSRRRAILVLTDNAGLNYKSPDEPVVQALLETGIVLDAIVPGRHGRPKPPRSSAPLNPDFSPADVFRIAEATGGEAVRDERVDRSFPQMIERIRLRYSLQYKAPKAPSGEYRRIRVELSPEAQRLHPKAVLQSRGGYYTEKLPASLQN